MAEQVKWTENELFAEVEFGPLVLHAFQDPRDETRYRYRIGSKLSRGKYTTMNGAKLAGLQALDKACEDALDSIDPLIVEEQRIFKEIQSARLKKTRDKQMREKKANEPMPSLLGG